MIRPEEGLMLVDAVSERGARCARTVDTGTAEVEGLLTLGATQRRPGDRGGGLPRSRCSPARSVARPILAAPVEWLERHALGRDVLIERVARQS